MEPDRQDPLKAIRRSIDIERAFGIASVPVVRRDPASNNKANALAALYAEFADCRQCALAKSRTKLVFGQGDPEARLMFVGEAPGYDEDQQGEPFVGAAGQLLTKIIEAMKLKRAEVYIANCLKCRPPGNRNPLPTEITSCQPILARQIEIIRPSVICALGKFAAQTLLATDEPISRLRGRFHEWKDGIRVMATFHPAYLLRNPDDKKLVWEDMRQIMRHLGIAS